MAPRPWVEKAWLPCCIHTYTVYTSIGGKGRCHTRCDLWDHRTLARKSAGERSTPDLKPMRKDRRSPKLEKFNGSTKWALINKKKNPKKRKKCRVLKIIKMCTVDVTRLSTKIQVPSCQNPSQNVMCFWELQEDATITIASTSTIPSFALFVASVEFSAKSAKFWEIQGVTCERKNSEICYYRLGTFHDLLTNLCNTNISIRFEI